MSRGGLADQPRPATSSGNELPHCDPISSATQSLVIKSTGRLSRVPLSHEIPRDICGTVLALSRWDSTTTVEQMPTTRTTVASELGPRNRWDALVLRVLSCRVGAMVEEKHG
jgi:hypothetical protein